MNDNILINPNDSEDKTGSDHIKENYIKKNIPFLQKDRGLNLAGLSSIRPRSF